jgi:hypothetical protein
VTYYTADVVVVNSLCLLGDSAGLPGVELTNKKALECVELEQWEDDQHRSL